MILLNFFIFAIKVQIIGYNKEDGLWIGPHVYIWFPFATVYFSLVLQEKMKQIAKYKIGYTKYSLIAGYWNIYNLHGNLTILIGHKVASEKLMKTIFIQNVNLTITDDELNE